MDYFKTTIISLILLTTIFICILKPKMHKKVVIGDAFVVVQKTVDQKAKEVFHPERANTKESMPRKQAEPQSDKFPEKNQSSAPVKEAPRPNYTPAPQAVQQQFAPIIKPEQKSKLTAEQEEIIAWNNWRSNLQNRVMKDSKLRAPIGTVFKFSFTVDKYGTVSNLKVWSSNSDYTPMAVRTVKPAILSYQGQSILNFPPQSKRVITNVEGGFTIWYQTDYSSPNDYSDYERVK